MSQVVERLAKASEKRDLLVLNFGLHFSEAYEEELKLLVQQVMTHRAALILSVKSTVMPHAPARLPVRTAEDAVVHLETWQPLEPVAHCAGAAAEEGWEFPIFAMEGHGSAAF